MGLLILTIVSCTYDSDTNHDSHNVEILNYLLSDSIISTSNTFNPDVIIDHFPINKEIEIKKIINLDLLVYNSDTFTRYNSNNLMYVKKQGNFPLINFYGDNIDITTKLGGVGTQTWQHLVGIKLP